MLPICAAYARNVGTGSREKWDRVCSDRGKRATAGRKSGTEVAEPRGMGQENRSIERIDDAGGLEALFDDLLQRSAEERDGRKPNLRDWVELAEAWRIAHALRDSRGNRSAAARALGIGRRTLYSKMEKLGIEPSWGFRKEVAPAPPARLNGVSRMGVNPAAGAK